MENQDAQSQYERNRVDKFMLAEYSSLQDGRDSMNTIMNMRVNVYFTLATFAAALLGAVHQSKYMSHAVTYITTGALALLTVLGFMVFIWVLEARITLITYVRGMNRIRRYFSENCPDVREFLVMPIDDHAPPFRFGYTGSSRYDSLSHLSGIVALIDTAALIGLAASICWNIGLMPIATTVLCVVTFVVSIAGHIRYQESRMVAAEAQLAQRIKAEMDPAITGHRTNQHVAG
jgi:hypothetical protein